TARARVVAAELFDQLLLASAHKAQPALDPSFAREALTPLGRPFESRGGRGGRRYALAWSISLRMMRQLPPQPFGHGGRPGQQNSSGVAASGFATICHGSRYRTWPG